MNSNTKENIQYTTAITGLVSGIVMCFLMCFLSFFLNQYEISGSVLGYLGEWIIFASSVFGFSLYVKTKFLEAESRMDKKMTDRLNLIEEEIKEEKIE